MHLKTVFAFAGAVTLLSSSLGATAGAHASAPVTIAQAAGAAVAPSSLQEKDARMTACSRYRTAFHRLDKVRSELTELQSDFGPTDDIRPKLDALVTQTNDALMASKVRVESCPGQSK